MWVIEYTDWQASLLIYLFIQVKDHDGAVGAGGEQLLAVGAEAQRADVAAVAAALRQQLRHAACREVVPESKSKSSNREIEREEKRTESAINLLLI